MDLNTKVTYSFIPTHRDDFSLKIAAPGVPPALIDAELAQAVVTSVLIRLGDDPGGSVGDAEVQDLALDDEVVEALHELGDARAEVPPVHVEEVDVVSLQLPEGGAHGGVQALAAITGEVCLLGGRARRKTRLVSFLALSR